MVLANIRKDPALLLVVFLLASVQSQYVTTPGVNISGTTVKPLDHSEPAIHLTPSGAHKTNHQTSSGYLKALFTQNNAGILTKPATPKGNVSPSAENEEPSNTRTAVTAGMVSSHHTPLKDSVTMKPTVQPSSPEPLITTPGPSATTSASKLTSPHLSSTSESSFTPTAFTTTSSNAPSPIQEVKHSNAHTMTSGSPTTATTNSTLGSTASLDPKTTSWPIKITKVHSALSTKAESSSTSRSQSSSMKISHSSTKSPVTMTSSTSATEATSSLSPSPTSSNSSGRVFPKTEFSSTSHHQPSMKTKTSTTTETTLPFSAASNSTNSTVPVFPLIPRMTTKSLPTARTSPPSAPTEKPTEKALKPCSTEKPTEKALKPCSTNHRSGEVNQCLIAIAALALIATIFMVSTVILCAKLSARKHRDRYLTRESQQGTELVCISALLPEKNCPYGRHTNPRSNGALLHSTEDDSDEDMGDNLTLNSFLPENDRSV